MMTRTLQIFMLLAIALYFLLLFFMLRKKVLGLKYTLLWMLSGFLMLTVAIFPKLLDYLSGFLGIYDPTNALYALILFCVIIILMSLTSMFSGLNEKNKILVQTIALLEKRVRELEEGETRSC